MNIISSRKLCTDTDYDLTVAEGNVFLPEDLWLNIFRRLPLESVFQFMCVSKGWCSVLTMASKSLTMPVPFVFYGPPIIYGMSPVLHACRYDGMSFKFLDTEIFNYKYEIETKLRLLASSNGLVLFVKQFGYPNNNVRYYVCNPLTKKWDSIPRRPRRGHSRKSDGYSFIHGFICSETSSSASTCSNTSVSYKVIRIREEKEPTREFEIEIFASDLGEWNTYSVLCPQQVTWDYYFSRRFRRDKWYRLALHVSSVVATSDDVLYWFQGDFQENIIAYDLNHRKDKYAGHDHPQYRLIELPKVIDEQDLNCQCLGESEGFVYYSRVEQQTPMSLSIWILNDKGKEYKSNISEAHGCCWELVHKIELKDILPKDEDSEITDGHDFEGKVIYPLAFHPTNRDVLILEYDFTYTLAYNMRFRSFELLQAPESADYFNPQVITEIPFLVTPSPTTIPRISSSPLFS